MESFSLLKYWRTTTTTTSTTTSISPSTTNPLPETEDSSYSASSSDEGPFFDLEFAVRDDGEEDDLDPVDDDDEDDEFNFSLPADRLPHDHLLPLSPSDDLFFKGRLLPLEPTSDPNSKHHLFHHHHHHNHHLSLKSKLLVFALGLKKHHHKHKAPSTSDPATSPATHGSHNKQHGGKFFAVKLEEVPIVSLFTRDGSSRASGSSDRSQRPSVDEDDLSRRFSKETLHRYLNKIKPLHVKASKRHAVKTTTSDHHHSRPLKEAGEHEASEAPSRLRVVCKHLGKSRSASSAVAAAPSPSPPPPAVARRRDDSLLQQQDGIQSAIAHCKRSFNGTREMPESTLPRSKSDSCDERACTEKCMEDCL